MSVYGDILDAVVDEIQNLGLTDIAPGNVKRMKIARDRKADLPTKPGVIVSTFGSKEIPATGGTNLSDDKFYPVAVVTLQSSENSQTANAERHLTWLEAIEGKFINKRLSGASTVQTCNIAPRDTFDPSSFVTKNVDAGGMVLRFRSREVRT